jgi:hypothetical protein
MDILPDKLGSDFPKFEVMIFPAEAGCQQRTGGFIRRVPIHRLAGMSNPWKMRKRD